MRDRRDIILVLQCVCRAYDVRSVARLRRTQPGTTWLPRLVAGTILACLGLNGDDIAPILRIYTSEVFDHQRLLAVLVADNEGIRAEATAVLKEVDRVLAERYDWWPVF